jgi:PleD family two-component response regulator
MKAPSPALIIDSNVTSAEETRKILASLGIIETKIMPSLAEAKLFLDQKPALITLIDIDTDTEEKLGFIRWIRRNTAGVNYQMTILALSAQPTKELVSNARDAGATEFVLKPLDKLIMKEIISISFTKPRNFIISRGYVGPERRRKKKAIDGEERRKDK